MPRMNRTDKYYLLRPSSSNCGNMLKKRGWRSLRSSWKTRPPKSREVFNQMISGIEEGQASGILAWHPDRLTRNSIDGGRIIYLVDIGKKFPTFWFDCTLQRKFMLSIAFGQARANTMLTIFRRISGGVFARS